MQTPWRCRLKFQSRNRESFLFKSELHLQIVKLYYCFNLAIENLFFSSFRQNVFATPGLFRFQSRNRESFLFKCTTAECQILICTEFQSRNRESFLFKEYPTFTKGRASGWVSISQSRIFSFQGRHRQFDERRYWSFNLAIENLFFSSCRTL